VGEGYILLRFEDTPSRRIGGWISMATVGVLVIAGIVQGLQRRKNEMRD
jgi:hypothetical protein